MNVYYKLNGNKEEWLKFAQVMVRVVKVVTIRSSLGSKMKYPTVKLCIQPTEADAVTVKKLEFSNRGDDLETTNITWPIIIH